MAHQMAEKLCGATLAELAGNLPLPPPRVPGKALLGGVPFEGGSVTKPPGGWVGEAPNCHSRQELSTGGHSGDAWGATLLHQQRALSFLLRSLSSSFYG